MLKYCKQNETRNGSRLRFQFGVLPSYQTFHLEYFKIYSSNIKFMVLIFKKMIAGRNIPKNLITRIISRQEVTRMKKKVSEKVHVNVDQMILSNSIDSFMRMCPTSVRKNKDA